MAEWLARWTGNPAGPGLESRSGHLLDLFSVVPSLNPRPCQVLNRKLVASCQLGFLILLCVITKINDRRLRLSWECSAIFKNRNT